MFTLNCKGRLLKFDKPLVMGIINTTPDSFYEESRYNSIEVILNKVEQMIIEGADIIDIGGQSSRPGSETVSEIEEMERVIPVIKTIASYFPDAILSIDSFYAKVAKAAVEAGAGIVNDISAGNMDAEMIKTVSSLNVPFIIMHMKGIPKTMQDDPHYENMNKEVLDFFIERIATCKNAGIKDLIIDPGIGFGKTSEQNFELLKNLSLLKILECPILLGVSRKSLIYKTLNISPAEALNGTSVLNSFALMASANILRVHDVKEAKQTIQLFSACFR